MGPGIYNIYAGLFLGRLFKNDLYYADSFHLTQFTQNAVWHWALSVCVTEVFAQSHRGRRAERGREREWRKRDLPWRRMTQIITPPFFFSCRAPLTWTLWEKPLISSVKNLRMPFWCQRKGLMKFWCGALRCMVNSDASKLTLSLLNRLQPAERSASLSLSMFFFPSVSAAACVSLSWHTLSLLSLDMLITSSLLPSRFIYWFWCNNKMQCSNGNSYFTPGIIFFLMKWQLLRFNISNYCWKPINS